MNTTLANHSTDDRKIVLVLNCGSSSIKFALYDGQITPLPRTPVWGGKVEGIGSPAATLTISGAPATALNLDATHPYTGALAAIREQVVNTLDGEHVDIVGHRVVHGGAKYAAPIRIDAARLADLRTYIPLAPLHQPFALEAISALLEQRPDIAQIACFDTAFHHTLPIVEQMMPLPWSVWARGIRRFGFHGLSYEFQSIALAERYPALADKRVIVAHLGSGASLCAMRDGKSIATTMGFSALDGLMMGTRCGSLDPGAVIYLMEIEKLTLDEVSRMLYHDSGLLGVSGLSADPRVLFANEASNPQASAALDLYVQRALRELGSLIATLGGLDMLVFTAGIGEHSARLRQRLCAGLAFMGIELDPQANQADALSISTATSTVRVVVEPTNEEWVIAQHALEMLDA